MQTPNEIVQGLRKTFKSGKTLDLNFREKQLKALLRLYRENEQAFVDAVYKDFRKPRLEAVWSEVNLLKDDVKSMLMNFRDYAKPEKPVNGNISNFFDTLKIYNDPYGVVLIIGPWNFPFNLIFLPLSGAIAAGNCVVIKPSEISSHSSKVMAELIPKYLDKDCYRVFEGGVLKKMELLKQRFDYIFFTGSTVVGKIVHAAANKYLTPTTLELGGKNPVYLDCSSNILRATRRIIWGKFANGGQMCVASDYIICTKDVEKEFIAYAKKVIKEFYGNDIKSSPDLARIINRRNFDRLSALLDNANIVIGGARDASDLYIEPTVVTNVKPTDPLMQTEIFGPILLIFTVKNVQEAIDYLKDREKPLAFYIFSKRKGVVDRLLKHTSSGGVCVNDTVTHLLPETLPFGGVGSSGMGAYHGKASFDTFVHKKSILFKDVSSFGESLLKLRYPPYKVSNLKSLVFLSEKRTDIVCKWTPYALVFILGAAAAYIANFLSYYWFVSF